MTTEKTTWTKGWFSRHVTTDRATSSRCASQVWLAALLTFALVAVPGFGPGVASAQSLGNDQATTALGLEPVFSPDGTKLARVGADGLITVIDLASGRELATLGGGQGRVGAIAFSADGRLLASAGGDLVSLWGLEAGAKSSSLPIDGGRAVTRLAFSPTGERLAAVVDDAEVALWELGAGTGSSVLPPTGEPVTDVVFNADGSLLASVGTGPRVTVWDVASLRQHRLLSSPTAAPVTGVLFSPRGSTLAAADEDANISLWDLDTGGSTVLSGHTDLIKRIRFSPNGARLASEGMDAQLIVWGLDPRGGQVALPARLDSLVTGLAFSPNGSLLASVGVNDEVLLWDAASGALVQTLEGQAALVSDLVFGSAGQSLASVGADGRLIVWNLASGTQQLALQAPAAGAEALSGVGQVSSGQGGVPVGTTSAAAGDIPTTAAASATPSSAKAAARGGLRKGMSKRIRALAVSADGSKVAAAGDGGLVRLGVGADDALGEESADTGAGATGLAFSPIRRSLYSVSRDSQVRRWSAANGQLVQALHGHEHPITAVAVSHDDRYIASAGEETRIMLWSETGKLVRILNAHRDFVNAVAFNPKRLELASAGRDGLILLWNPEQPEPLRALLGHAGPVNAIAYTSDGQTLASGSSDNTIKLWSLSDGRQLANIAHAVPVRALAVSRNDRFLASAGDDSRIFIWDLKAGNAPFKVLNGSAEAVASLAFLPSGRLLAGGADGSVTVWNVQNNRAIRSIKPAPLASADGTTTDGSGPLPEQDQVAVAALGGAESTRAGTLSGLVAGIAGRILDWLVPAAGAAGLENPNQGPGGPILVIKSPASPFGTYYAEMLRAEGFNAFSVADLASVTSGMLASYDLVILAPTPSLTSAQVTMLTDWVNAGGNLIAMGPDPQLAGLLGLTTTGQTLSEGYLAVNTSAPPGNGIVGETMQFHGTASRFTLNGATAVANLYSNATTATANPAVTLRSVGSNGGQAAAFAYDLATSIVYTRQGKPEWANDERDGFAPQRSDDKYYGNKVGDPQPDWVDLNKVAIPQADEQQRLLANLMLHMTLDRKPLPRFWYFPRGHKAVVLMTGDDHGNNGTAGRWDSFLLASPAGCSVADWECVRGTSYMYPSTPMTNAQAVAYEAQGFEVGLHVDTNCADYTEAELQGFYAAQLSGFASSWPSAAAPTTQRHHCIAWTDWVTAAKVQAQNGVRLDTSYYFWPPSWVDNRPGFFNGSGLPMRFADLDGTLINVYQAATQMTDESGQQYPYTIDTLLDRALGAEGYYGTYVINAHTDLDIIPESTATVASALARGVPIITSRQLLQWLDGRDTSSFGSIAWIGNTLSFSVTAGAGANGLQALVPWNSTTGVVGAITLNGAATPYTLVTRKGVAYAAFTATTGTYQVSYGADTTPPTVIAQTPVNGATGVSRGTTVSVTFSEPMNAATITGARLQLNGPSGAVAATVTYSAETRTATLTPAAALAGDTSYTATLNAGASDLAGNAIVGAISWTFTTEPPVSSLSVWDNSVTPATASASDPNAVELGVKFRSTIGGYITGVRFYKGSLNTGTHVGNLWTSGGTLLASATFTNETATGWQQVSFATPVAVSANTTYVASYHAPNGGYAINSGYFAASGVDKPPLRLLSDSEASGNGVYGYGASAFPNQSWNASNYWVDVVFSDTGGSTPGDTTPPTVTSTAPLAGATGVSVGTTVTAVFSEAMDAATITSGTFELRAAGNTLVPATVTYTAATRTATLTPTSALAASATYTARVLSGASGVKDLAGNALAVDLTWSFTTAAAGGGACATPCSLWNATATPAVLADPDASPIELGVKFRSSVDGVITGVRFYKSAQNTGTHIGKLWSNSGQLLAQATFVNETASGWQEVSFASPIAISANTVYVASYHTTVGRYSANTGYFASAFTNGPLTGLANSESANGVYQYGSGGFPTNTYQSTNYWVDVVMTTNTGPDTTPPQVTSTTPLAGAANVLTGADVKATFNESIDPATINVSTFELRNASATLVSATVTYDAVTRTATLRPNATLALSTQYTATVKGGSNGVKDLAANALAADVTWTFTTAATDPCAAGNAIVRENCLAGNPKSEWDVSGAGDPSIQGFATDISVNRGGTVNFKISTPAIYRLDIYRMGYYGGSGARKVATVGPLASQPQQGGCQTDSTTGLVDCGNWAVSASWTVPANATSGIYFAKAIRGDTGGASHIVFIVRDDASTSDVLFQTSDTTWHAYNTWGGNSLYTGTGPGTGGSADGRAYKVSYNRPFNTREVAGGQDWVFSAEYPMVRWLEANGYDVSYFTGVDADRSGSLIRNHKLFLSVGHDEYWSAQQRANVEGARDAGVHLAFFSGNEVFWKTRWENGLGTSGAPYRTLVCYKETHNYPNNPDPLAGVWTGTWRDPRNVNKDGRRPENALMGTIFTVNDGATTAIQVPAEDGKMRFWRNTSVANLAVGNTATLARGTLGYEWDEDLDNGFRPAGIVRMSTTTVLGAPVLTDFGSTFGSGTATHSLTLYRASSGALVFGAGTVQWSWGLDPNYDDVFNRGGDPADPRMQQATVNLFADMRVQPTTLQANLVAAAASTDTTAPTSTITSPTAGANLPVGTPVTVTGTATDSGGGVVGGVEVSVDGGTTWRRANGRTSWSYTWTPLAAAAVTIRARAVDDSANLEAPGAGVAVTIGTGGGPTLTSIAVTPASSTIAVGATQAFTATGTYSDGSNQNLSTQVTWSSTSTAVATIATTGVATGVSSGNTTIRATLGAVSGSTTLVVQAGTLTSIAVTPANPTIAVGATQAFTATGTYSDGSTQNLTTQVTWSSSSTAVATITSAGVATAVSVGSTTITATLNAVSGGTGLSVQAAPLAVTTASLPGGTVGAVYAATLAASGGTPPYTWSISSGALPAGLTLNAATGGISGTPTVQGTASFSVQVRDSAIPAVTATAPLSIQVAAAPTGCTSNCTIWSATATPGMASSGDTSAVELGVKFRSDVAGSVKGIRFYKGSGNTGTHVGKLWSATGALLTSATFTGETASGWQQVNFATPVAIQANTVYVASYLAPNGGYAYDGSYFATAGVDNPPLHALQNGVSGGNAVYLYGAAGGFPVNTYNSANYWVDVVFDTGAAPTPTLSSIAVAPASATIAVGATQAFTATGTYSDGSTQNLTTQVTWSSSSTAVATITSTGVTTGVSAGSTTITATLAGVSGTATLTVQVAVPTPTLSSIAVTPASPTIAVGATQQFAATGTYSDNSTQNLTALVTWSSSSTAVATITSTGVATGVSAGSTTITASLSGVTGSTALSVNAPPVLNTGFRAPTANAPVTINAGDNNGFASNPTGAYTAGGLVAADFNSGINTSTVCTDTGKDKHVFSNLNLSFPNGAAIRGIEVRLRARAESTSGTPRMCVQFSWDGGTSWTAAQQTTTLGTTFADRTLGSATNTWGRTWAVADFSNTSFRVRVINTASSIDRDFFLDALGVQVTYQ